MWLTSKCRRLFLPLFVLGVLSVGPSCGLVEEMRLSESSGQPVITASSEESAATLENIKTGVDDALLIAYILSGMLGVPMLGVGAQYLRKKVGEVQIKSQAKKTQQIVEELKKNGV